jgi:hypothetical protein
MDTQNLLYNGIGNLYNKMYDSKNIVIEDITNDAGNFGTNNNLNFHSEKAYSPQEYQNYSYSYKSPTISPKNSPNPYLDNNNEDELFTNNPMNSEAFKTPIAKNKVILNNLKQLYYDEGGTSNLIKVETFKKICSRI